MPTPKLVVASHARHLREGAEHLRDFLRGEGRELDLEFLEVGSPEELPDAVLPLKPSAVRLDPDLSSHWLSQCPLQPLPVSVMGAADFFQCVDGRWESDLLLDRSLHDVIVRLGKTIELNDWAYAIGEGAELRVIAGVCLGLGVRKLRLVSDRENDLREQRGILRKAYVGSQVECLPAHSLTLQTVEASLLINALELGEDSELAGDLAYFNFMRRGGLILDLKGIGPGNAILEEAARAGLRAIPPFETTGACDLLVARKLGFDVDAKAYLESWRKRLENRPQNQPSAQ